MSAAVQVRLAGIAQLDVTTRLFQGYLQFYKKTVAAEDARRFIEDRLRQQDSVIFLASSDNEVLGFVQLYPCFASLSLAPSWVLNDLFVDKHARGRGVAEALMEAARKLGVDSGAAEIFLQTARSNTAAQALYEKLGYQRDDEFLVYTLSLPKPTSRQ